MSFTAIEVTDKTAAGGPRHDFARALCEAALRGKSWTPEAVEELRIAVQLLCRLDPRLAEEIADYASSAKELDDNAREGLLRLAAEQKRLAGEIPHRREMRSDTNILFDRRHYVRP